MKTCVRTFAEEVDPNLGVYRRKNITPLGGNLRCGRGHLAEEARASALLLHGRSLLGGSGGGVRLRLLLRSSRGPSRSDRGTVGSAARRGRGGTTALTRHVDGYV
jgi:hypothetical protein